MNEELTDLELLYNVLLLPSALSLIHRLLYNGNTCTSKKLSNN